MIILKHILNKIKPIYIFVFCILFLNVILLFSNYFKIKQNSYNSNYLRFHVTANSNSLSDQLLKYKIASKIANYIENLGFNSTYSKEEIKAVIVNNISNILDLAKETITDNNKDYDAKAKIGNIYYTAREKAINNNTLSMDPGIYDSINIIIGKGSGKNYWSLIYPYSYTAFCDIEDYDETTYLHIDNNSLLDDTDNIEISYSSYIIKFIQKLLLKV